MQERPELDHTVPVGRDGLVPFVNCRMLEFDRRLGACCGRSDRHVEGGLGTCTVIPSAAYRSQAQAARRQGALDDARELLHLAISAAADEGDVVARAMNISLLAEVHGAAGDLERAFELFADAAAAFELAGDLTSAGVTYHQWAKLLFLNARLEQAGDYFIMSAQCFAETDDDTMLQAVTGSFGTYLQSCNGELADQMTRLWSAERLRPLPPS